MRRVAMAGLCGAFAGCAAQPPPVAVSAFDMPPAVRTAVEDGVRRGLKDPASAQFGAMSATKGADGLIYVCGEVNARNSYGGYSGAQRFVGRFVEAGEPRLFSVLMIASDKSAALIVDDQCQRRGLRT